MSKNGATEIDTLRELLRIEYLRHARPESPWQCIERRCRHFRQSVPRQGCDCYAEFQAAHIAAVKQAIK
jgi:hypothetical protein